MVTQKITDVAALRSCIGKTPGVMHLKVIDHLDSGARRWLAASPVMFAAFASPAGIAMTLGGGVPGFITVVDPSRMRLRKTLLDHPDLAREGEGFGALSLVPTIGETLRINGRVIAVDQETIDVRIEECYVHCAKALIRSAFWNANPQPTMSFDLTEFLSTSRFIALGTADSEGHADVSPKGDPAGMMVRLSDGAAWFADRPGNRRADSFRNILTQPHAAMAALIPGATRVALLCGKARITNDIHKRAEFTVQEKAPLLATCFEESEVVLYDSAALQRAHLWPVRAPDDTIDPAAIIVAHVKHSKEQGLQATLVRAAVSVPGLMQKGLDRDYKTNLY